MARHKGENRAWESSLDCSHITRADVKVRETPKHVAEAICASGYRPDVVIIDPIYPLFIGDENSNEDAKTTLAYLKMVASRTGAGINYMHHFSKGGAGPQGGP